MNKLIILLLLKILFSCKAEVPTKDSLIPIIDLTDLDYINPLSLSDLVEDIDYIKLETTTDGLIGEFQKIYAYSDGFFIQQKGLILLFNNQGKFIKQLYRIGQGPEEGFARCCAIDHFNKLFFIYDNFSEKVKIYDFFGKYINQVKPKYTNEIHTRNMGAHNGLLIFGNDQLEPCFFSVFDFYNNLDSSVYSYKNNYTELKRKIVMYDAYAVNFQSFRNIFYFKEQFCDTIFYSTCFENIYPGFIFKWNKNDKLKYEINTKIRSLEISPKSDIENGKYRITTWGNTDKYLFFSILKNNDNEAIHRLGIYDKKEFKLNLFNREYVINDIDGGVDFKPLNFVDNNNFILNSIYILLFPRDLINEFHKNKYYKSKEKRDILKKIIDNLDEEDNPIVMVLKLKI
jgi:hypothetical protein